MCIRDSNDDAALAQAMELMQKHGALEETKERARRYGAEALDALSGLPASPVRAALADVVDFCIDRIN